MAHLDRSRIAAALTSSAMLASLAGVSLAPATASAGGLSQVLSLQTVYAGSSPQGISPSQDQDYYGFNNMGTDKNGLAVSGTGQTIGIVLWDNTPSLASDLQAFIEQYNLAPMLGLNSQACTVPQAKGSEPCFEVVNAAGTTPAQAPFALTQEAALDVEWAHVTAPGANIIFVQAASGQAAAMLSAIDTAVSLGSTVVSMSWDNAGMTSAVDTHFEVSSAGFVSGEGDDGFPETDYPAASTYVLSVGGTNLTADGSESAWDASGGGYNNTESRPGYQLGWTDVTQRSVNDVSYNATHYPIYDFVPPYAGPWQTVNGVSAGIPQWAGLVADADQIRVSVGNTVLASSGLPSAMYFAAGHNETQSDVINPAYFRDITTGCAYAYDAQYKLQPPCVDDATAGYDQVTGLGTPKAAGLVPYLGYDL